MQYLLTIIIPYYNVSKYIDCLHASIFSELNDKVEVLFIEDNSTDGTKEVLLDLEAKNNRKNVKFFFQSENKGLSEARNTGLKHATGEYILFLDSDDILVEGGISKLIDVTRKTDVDMIFFDFFYLYDSFDCPNKEKILKLKRQSHMFKANYIYKENGFLTRYLKNEKIYAWMFIAKKTLYETISFPKGVYFEDISTSPKLVKLSKSFYYLDQSIVYYRQRENSIMGNPSVQSCLDYASAMVSSIEFCEKNRINNIERKEMYQFYFKTLRWALNDMQDHHLINHNSYRLYKEKVDQFYYMLEWNKWQFLKIIYQNEKINVSIFSLLFLVSPSFYLMIRKIGNLIKNG